MKDNLNSTLPQILLTTHIGKLLQVEGKMDNDALTTTKTEFLNKYERTVHFNILIQKEEWEEFYDVVHDNTKSISSTSVYIIFKAQFNKILSLSLKSKTLSDFLADPFFTNQILLKPRDFREFYNTVKKNLSLFP